MTLSLFRLALASATLALLTACSSLNNASQGTSTAATPLFSLLPTPNAAALKKDARGYLATLLGEPANQSLTFVELRPTAISASTQTLSITLPTGKQAAFALSHFDTTTPGMQSWVGYVPSAWKKQRDAGPAEIAHDPLYYLSLTRQGDTVVGTMLIDGKPFKLDTLSPGNYALIAVDESKLPPQGPPLESTVDVIPADVAGHVPKSTHSTVRVLFVTTIQSRDRNPNIRVSLANALNDANQYMKNSKVEITYQLAGFMDADYDETGRNTAQQLNDMRLAVPFGAQLLRVRETVRADLVSMYSTATDYCGRAWLSASKAQAHSVVSCAASLAHEIGHNLGVEHNWQAGDPVRTPPYMHGYRQSAETPRFRTQMSAECSPSCPRIAYHSTPRLTYQGLPLGTVEHHDAARRFNERREVVEAFYPPVDGLAMTVYEQANFQGKACTVALDKGRVTTLSNDCGSQTARSFKVAGYRFGQFCLFDSSGLRHVCYAGNTTASRDIQVASIDDARDVPAGYVRRQKGAALAGAVVDATYDANVVQLFAQADFKQPLCSFAIPYGEHTVDQQLGCLADAGNKARSARIFNMDPPSSAHHQWCFLSENRTRTLCFTGNYWGKFGIANFDSTLGVPAELKRTQSGGYMNGSVFRIKFDIVSSQ